MRFKYPFSLLIFLAIIAPRAAVGASFQIPPIEKPLAYGTEIPPPTDFPSSIVAAPRTVSLLTDALSESQLPVDRRIQLLADLGNTAQPLAVAPLVAALQDSDPRIVAQAAASLGHIGGSDADNAIAPLLDNSNPMIVRAAILAGAELKDDSIVSSGLHSDDPQIVVAAIHQSWTRAQSQLIIARLTAKTLPPSAVPPALIAIGRIGYSGAAPVVAKFLSPENEIPIRAAAAQALARIATGTDAAAVSAALSDPNPTVRRYATEALAICFPRSGARAASMLSDPDPTVQSVAANVLAKFPDPSAIPQLVAYLSAPYPPLQISARDALIAACKSSSTSPAAIEKVVPLLADPDPALREIAACILGSVPTHAGFDQLIHLLDDPDGSVAAQAATSLGEIGDPSAAVAEMALVHRVMKLSDNGEISPLAVIGAERAIVACGQLGFETAEPYFASLISTRTVPAEIRCAAVWAFGVLAPGPADIDRQTFSFFQTAYGDRREPRSLKLEILKAVGNRKSAENAWFLQSVEKFPASVQDALAAHWGLCRMNGVSTPLDIEPIIITPDVSITARSSP